MDSPCPDLVRLADTLSLLHMQMHKLAGTATAEQAEALGKLLGGSGHED